MDGSGGGGRAAARPKQKTPLQKEVLEASYMINQNPTPEHCRALAQRIQLTEKEVRDWFSGRRRRLRQKEQKAADGSAPPSAAASSGGAAPPAAAGSPQLPPRPGASSPGACTPAGGQPWAEDVLDGLGPEEEAQLLELAKRQLPQPYRNDGPPLAVRFDPPPPGAAPAAAAAAGAKRRADAQAAPDGKRSRGGSYDGARTPGHESGAASDLGGDADGVDQGARQEAEARAAQLEAQVAELQQRLDECTDPWQAPQLQALLAQRQEALAQERGRLEAAARQAEERLAQQRAREAERVRAIQEREARRVQAQRDRERERVAASQQKKAAPAAPPAAPDDADVELQALLRAAGAAAQAEGRPPPSAEEVALARPQFPPESLGLAPAFAAPARGGGGGGEEPAAMECDGGGEQQAGGHPDARRRSVSASRGGGATAASAIPLVPGSLLDEETGEQLLGIWSFFATFGELLGVNVPGVPALLAALLAGRRSALLAALHCVLVRVVQADLEDAHASGLLQAVGQLHFADQARVAAAQALEEAWAWGFDTHQWRAHLNRLTWPEVLRQLATACGAGPRRTQRAADVSPDAAAEAAAAAADAAAAGGGGADAAGGPIGPQPGGRDDLVVYRYPDGTIARLKLPQRFGNIRTVKGACWRILVEADHNGMSLADVTAAIEARGLRDLSSSKSPEGTVGGALSRDAIFQKVRPLAWALQPHILHHAKMEKNRAKAAAAKEAAEAEAREKAAADAEAEAAEAEAAAAAAAGEGGGGAAGEAAGGAHEGAEGGGGGGNESDDDAAAAAAAAEGELWVAALAAHDYDDLDLSHRLAALDWLVHQALGLPTLRAEIDWRTDEAQAARRTIQEEAKADKRRREDEALARARAAAEDAQRRLEDLQRRAASGEPVGAGALAAAAAAAAKAAAGAAGIGGGGAEGAETEAEREQQRRLQARAEAMQRVEDACQIRYEPLGLDRRHNRYWAFAPGGCGAAPATGEAAAGAGAGAAASGGAAAAAALPAGAAGAGPEDWGRVWVELSADDPGGGHGGWALLQRQEQLQQLKACLDARGAREGHLAAGIARAEAPLTAAMPGRALLVPSEHKQQQQQQQQQQQREGQQQQQHAGEASPGDPGGDLAGDVTGDDAAAEEALLLAQHAARLLDPGARDAAARAPVAAAAAAAAGAPGAAASSNAAAAAAAAALKRALLLIEAALEPAMAPGGEGHEAARERGWERFAWAQAVLAAGDLAEVRQLLGRFESAMDRKLLARGWRPAPPMVRGAWRPWRRRAAAREGGAGAEQEQQQQQQQEQAGGPAREPTPGEPEPLGWLPPTASALAWRVASLDAALLYPACAGVPGRTRVAGYRFVLRPAPLRPPLSLAGALAEVALEERRRARAAWRQQQEDGEEGQQQEGGEEEAEEQGPRGGAGPGGRRLSGAGGGGGSDGDGSESGGEALWGGGPGAWLPPGGVMYGGLLAEVGRGRPGTLAKHSVALPPFPDRSLYAYSSAFSFPVDEFASAADGARQEGLYDLTPAEVRKERARRARRAAADARAAEAAARAEGHRAAAEEAARAAAAAAAAGAAAAAALPHAPPALPPPAYTPPAAAAAPPAAAAPAVKLPPRVPLKIKVKVPGASKPTSPTNGARPPPPAGAGAPRAAGSLPVPSGRGGPGSGGSSAPPPPRGSLGPGGGSDDGQRSPTIGLGDEFMDDAFAGGQPALGAAAAPLGGGGGGLGGPAAMDYEAPQGWGDEAF